MHVKMPCVLKHRDFLSVHLIYFMQSNIRQCSYQLWNCQRKYTVIKNIWLCSLRYGLSQHRRSIKHTVLMAMYTFCNLALYASRIIAKYFSCILLMSMSLIVLSPPLESYILITTPPSAHSADVYEFPSWMSNLRDEQSESRWLISPCVATFRVTPRGEQREKHRGRHWICISSITSQKILSLHWLEYFMIKIKIKIYVGLKQTI